MDHLSCLPPWSIYFSVLFLHLLLFCRRLRLVSTLCGLVELPYLFPSSVGGRGRGFCNLTLQILSSILCLCLYLCHSYFYSLFSWFLGFVEPVVWVTEIGH